MTTLLHLSQAIGDMKEGLAREQRFSNDARRLLLSGTRLIREALDALERDINCHFDERDRSMANMIGTSQPHTTVVEAAASIAAHTTAIAADMFPDNGPLAGDASPTDGAEEQSGRRKKAAA